MKPSSCPCCVLSKSKCSSTLIYSNPSEQCLRNLSDLGVLQVGRLVICLLPWSGIPGSLAFTWCMSNLTWPFVSVYILENLELKQCKHTICQEILCPSYSLALPLDGSLFFRCAACKAALHLAVFWRSDQVCTRYCTTSQNHPQTNIPFFPQTCTGHTG